MNLDAKSKAEELVEKYASIKDNCNSFEYDKKCALIAVDEIIKVLNNCIYTQNEETSGYYWQEVKQEIEKL